LGFSAVLEKGNAMFRVKDLVLLLVVFFSMVVAILLPRFGSLFQPYPLYCMMLVLFLSSLSIEMSSIWHTLRNCLGTIIFLSFLKTVVLPIGVYFIFKALCPSYAIAALLLSGISTGAVAPFISNMAKANSPLVLVMVVTTSLLAPFTLPGVIKVVLARSTDISLFPMIRMLTLVVFVPFLAAESLRRLSRHLAQGIIKRQFSVSLTLFAFIILGAFSKYAEFFYQNPATIGVAFLVAVMLSAIYLLVGILSLPAASRENQMAAAISLGNMNSVLIVVFASHFFGPLEATVAALYLFPFFAFILPIRIYKNWRLPHKLVHMDEHP
jgi:BASS family bile acid:Na+ symporter